MVAGRPEVLFQIVVGARQTRYLITVEETRPIAVRHGQEMIDGRRERRHRVAPSGHRGQQRPIGGLSVLHRPLLIAPQEMGRVPDPGIGLPQIRPEGGGRLQALPEERIEALQRPWQAPLFSATRPIDVWMASTRSRNATPGASNGGWPSSLRAPRTARQ